MRINEINMAKIDIQASINAVIKIKGWEPKHYAKLMGVSTQTLNTYGGTSSISTLVRLAEVAGIGQVEFILLPERVSCDG